MRVDQPLLFTGPASKAGPVNKLLVKKKRLLVIPLALIYSNKKDMSDFHGTVSFDPIKMSQQEIYQNVYQTSDTQKLVII